MVSALSDSSDTEATFRVTRHTTLPLDHASHVDTTHVFNADMHTNVAHMHIQFMYQIRPCIPIRLELSLDPYGLSTPS